MMRRRDIGYHDSEPQGPDRLRDPRRSYVGERTQAGCRVWILERDGTATLTPREHRALWSFGWGRPGLLARELSWALLFDSTGSRTVADDWCAGLSAEVVSRLPREGFILPVGDVLGWLATVPAPAAATAAEAWP